MEIVLVVAIAAAIITAIVVGQIIAGRRREALAGLAARLGLQFEPDKDRELAERLDFLRRLNDGSNRYAYNRISGNFAGHEVMAFDFHYQVRAGKHTHNHHFSVLTLRLPRSFPELLITPEGLFSKIAQSLGYDDIDFESAEFSRSFCVRGADRKFAYAVCHPQMMEYLLARRELAVEVEGHLLAMAFDTRLDAPEIEARLGQLVEIRRLIPDYLFTQT